MKRKRILAALGVLCALVLGFLAYRWMFPPAYQVGEDEVALYIRLDLEEDIGLVVFDYTVDGREHGGGISNADRSLIRRDEEIIHVWEAEDLGSPSGIFDLTMRFRIITEYVDPNFENVYPEEITRRLDPVSWKAETGKAYDVFITGSRDGGYAVSVSEHGG